MSDYIAATRHDMALVKKLLPYTKPADIPLSFMYGDTLMKGIPEEFNPKADRWLLTSDLVQYVITGENADGLEIRAEYLEYRDFPVTEWVVYFTNKSGMNTPILSDIKVVDGILEGKNPVLMYGNGDTCKPDGYEFFRSELIEPLTLFPVDGTSCNGAFPYMRLMFGDWGINMAVGWPAQWEAQLAGENDGVAIKIGQKNTHMYLKPNETIRTPRVNFMGFTGDEDKGRNMWRRWYFKHILPRENGAPLPPKLCLHTFMIEGKPEFTGITEENQLYGIDQYLFKGLHPDIWWIDAGWYPCDYDWTHTGTWYPDPKRLPNGLTPVGEKCQENNISLLLWFEPERVRPGTDLATNRPEWLLSSSWDNKNKLLNLGNRNCCDWLIKHVDKLIQKNKINIYRQDFNFAPLSFWVENEGEDRRGFLENQHVQGYLRYWDELILRNPGLWIDSCASGGRRNDLETMRRAVPLHYTDVGYGHHPIKQKQYRAMLEWIPYFRSHTQSWDNDDGTYTRGKSRPVDAFAYHTAIAPSITSLVEYFDDDRLIELAKKMHPIWREAAELMLSGDYYPLSECRKSEKDYYAVQFDDIHGCRGFIQVVRNTLVKNERIVVYPFADDKAVYIFENKETGERKEIDGIELKDGFTVEIPKRSGVIWFYHKWVKA